MLTIAVLFLALPTVLGQAQERPDSTLNRRSLSDSLLVLPPDKAEVSVVSDQQMDFGQLADKSGAAVLGVDDAITSDPNLIVYGGSPYSAICTISGDPATAVDVGISSIPTNGLSLSSFVSSEGALPLIGVVLDGSGELVLNFGATITVDSAQAVIGGGQTISYTITATYN